MPATPPSPLSTHTVCHVSQRADTAIWLPRFPHPSVPACISSGIMGVYPAAAETQESSGAACHPPHQAPAAAHESASPVVAAVGPGKPSPWPVPLPAQQVQAAAVAGRHAEGPIGTQHLARWAVAAGLAMPHAVLGGHKGRHGSAGDRAEGARRGALRSGRRATGER